MRELVSDFRSHTFNQKLMTQRLREMNMAIHVLSNDIKKKFIEQKIMAKEDFIGRQQHVNKTIRSTFRFKFHEYKYTDILVFEHYAIAILGPLYNDKGASNY